MSGSRFPAAAYGWSLAVILLFAAAPFLSVMVAEAVASSFGCALNESGANVCMILGQNMGDGLAFLFVMGWFALMTLPLGGGALIVWLVLLIIHLLAWRQWQKAQTS